MSRARTTLPFALVCASLVACGSSEEEAAWTFRDVTRSSAVDFRYTFGDEEFSYILEDTGSGVATFDYNGDGVLDLYFVNGTFVAGVSIPGETWRTTARNQLYRGLGNGTFENVTERAGVGDPGYGMGVAVGDYDGDGDEDLYVLNYGQNVFYHNQGDGTFQDVTVELGLAGPTELNGFTKWSVNAFFFDYEEDGDLDLYVSNYLAFDPTYVDPNLPEEYPYSGPEAYKGQASILYRNDGLRFTDHTEAAGLLRPDGKTMGASGVDFDGDGLIDIVEAVDGTPNYLFRSRGDGTFEELGVTAGMAFDAEGNSPPSMHPTTGDYDGDGDEDVFMTDLDFGCLYRNEGRMSFAEVRRAIGLGPDIKASGWGSAFEDFDNDGDLDLLIVFGGAFSCGAGEIDRLFLNDGEGGFEDATQRLGGYFVKRNTGRGVACGDFDGDGDVDFAINTKDIDGAPSIVRNDLPAGNHWVDVRLVGEGKNRDAIGARVELRAGGKTQTRRVLRSGSYLSQGSGRLHFGLGAAASIDSIRVTWPSGAVLDLPATEEVDGVLVIEE